MNILLLIAKDLRLQRNFLAPLLLLELVGYLAYWVQMPSHIPGVAFGLLHGVALIGGFLICYRTTVAEEKNRALLFIKTLPVSTAEIVLAKFGVNMLLVGLNTCILMGYWGLGHKLGLIEVQPNLTVHLLLTALTYQCFNNAFFVAISLAFSSERAVFIPFPAIFLVMSAILNFRKIEAALHLQPFVELCGRYDLVFLALLWMIIAGFAGASLLALQQKRVFA